MRPLRYPLEPLATLREDAVDAAVRGLASAVAGRDAAERERHASEQRLEAHEQAAARVRAAETDALARGELRAGDLARGGAWETRVASELATIAVDVDRAQKAEGRAREVEQGARCEVSVRKADAQVVDKDRERWRDGLRKKSEAKEEEEAGEAYRPRR
jgi:hypothetical protein